MQKPRLTPTERLARIPLGGPFLAGLIRRLWRPLFAIGCGWECYRILRRRARLVRSSPDWQRLPRVRSAGGIRGRHQIMHNGIRVRLGSYYGWGCVPFFFRTKGVHEPQEEIAFAAVLPLLPAGAVMVELGSYWAFYSLWFAQQVPGARNFLVEPDARGLETGRRNFADNGARGHFTRAFAGSAPHPGNGDAPTVTVDSFRREQQLERIHLLHADIQGAEREMLEGARVSLHEDRVDFLFLSTHGERLHAECRTHLAAHSRLRVLVDVPPARSYSEDGILVAARTGLRVPEISIALRA